MEYSKLSGHSPESYAEPDWRPQDHDLELHHTSITSSSDERFLYLIQSESLLLAEEKEHGQWGRGHRETDAERVARIEAQRIKTEETHKKVEAGLEELANSLAQGKSDTLLALLDSMGRFHNYSLGNTILILLQNPEATLVAGFSTWKEMGRYVKSGEKGIAILAPIPKRIRVEEMNNSSLHDEEEDRSVRQSVVGQGVRGFKIVYVFDMSQTEGKPLPELSPVKGDPCHYLPLLKEQISSAGIALEYKADLGGALGRSWGGRVELKTELTPAQEFSTLVHEFAHELLHPQAERLKIPKAVKETEAEAVSYVVSRAIGLDAGTLSSDYIQLYQGNTDTLAASLDRVQKTADHILQAIETHSDA